MERIQKQKIFFRGYFVGKKMLKSIEAMEVAMRCHVGFRKGGEPEVSHQFAIVGMILQVFECRLNTEELDIIVASAFLHDVVEDYSDLFNQQQTEDKFGHDVSRIVAMVTKPESFKKNHEDRYAYFNGMLKCYFAVFVKCFDRIHNLQSMIGGFKPDKQVSYIEETEAYFFPMIKKARAMYPEYYMVFVIIQEQMEMIIRLSEQVLVHTAPNCDVDRLAAPTGPVSKSKKIVQKKS